MRAILAQLMQHDPTAIASFLTRYGGLPQNFAGQQSSFIPPPLAHLQQHMQMDNHSQQCNDVSEISGQIQAPVNQQRSSGANSSSLNVNVMPAATAFMPTSVMRQMTKIPGGNSSVNS